MSSSVLSYITNIVERYPHRKMNTTDHEKAARTDTVTRKVFSTTELLEIILINVNDYQTLLFSQRVNSDFEDTIQGSTSLQQALLFKLDLDTHPAIPAILRDRKIIICHDGASVSLGYKPRPMVRCGNSRMAQDRIDRERYTDAELERRRAVELRLEVNRFPGGGQRSVEIGGSWQRIVLHNAQVRVLCDRRREYGQGPLDISLADGDTLGNIVDLALQFKTDTSQVKISREVFIG